jgi:hypothetical protein
MAWAPDYATTAELKAYVRISDSADDVQCALAVTAASRAIDQATNRQFGLATAAEDRYYTARWDRRRCRWVVDIDDLQTSTGLTVSVDTNDDGTYPDLVTEYAMRPVNAVAEAQPWTEVVVHPTSTIMPTALEAGVEVHAKFGWTAVPTVIKQACLLQASRILMRRDSPFGIAGSPEAGSELRLLAKVDPDVEVSLRRYRRIWGAV